jgi:hypothetical protein
VLLTGVAWNVSWFVLQAAYVPCAVRSLGLSTPAVGFTLGCYGAGMVLGALLAPRVVGAMAFGRAIQFGPAVSVLAAGAMVGRRRCHRACLRASRSSCSAPAPSSGPSRRRHCARASRRARCWGAAIGALVGGLWGEPACLGLAFAGFVLQACVILASSMNGLQHLPPAVEAAPPGLQPR